MFSSRCIWHILVVGEEKAIFKRSKGVISLEIAESFHSGLKNAFYFDIVSLIFCGIGKAGI